MCEARKLTATRVRVKGWIALQCATCMRKGMLVEKNFVILERMGTPIVGQYVSL